MKLFMMNSRLMLNLEETFNPSLFLFIVLEGSNSQRQNIDKYSHYPPPNKIDLGVLRRLWMEIMEIMEKI